MQDVKERGEKKEFILLSAKFISEIKTERKKV